MPRFDSKSAELLVFTFKEGLLAPLAHDLKLRADSFELTVEPSRDSFDIRLEVDPRSLRVFCAVKDGQDTPDALTNADRQKIDQTIVDTVLEVDSYPELNFVAAAVTSEKSGYLVQGALFLHGIERQIETAVKPDGADWVAELTLQQSDYGITPYSAMLGSLKIRGDLVVKIRVPDFTARAPGATLAA